MDTPQNPSVEIALRWTPEDVQYLCPDLTISQATDALAGIRGALFTHLSDYGWNALEWALIAKGYNVDPEYNDV